MGATPMPVELTNDEAKMLTMMLVEDRAGDAQRIRSALAPHGRDIFDGLVDKLAMEVLGIETSSMYHGRDTDPEPPSSTVPMSEKG